MITQKLDLTKAWPSHVQSDGSNIGGVDPAIYSCLPIPGKKPALLLATSGNSKPPSGYPAVEWYQHPLPIPQNTGNLQFIFDLTVDSNTLTAANVIETDTLIITNGHKFNLSGQRHVASGQIDVADANGHWADTGIRAGALVPNVKIRIVWTYTYDPVKMVCSVVSYACNGVVYPVPANLQNVPASASTWSVGVMPQFQMGSLPAGNPWSEKISGVKYRGW